MTRHDHAGLGNMVQALSLKVAEMQRELVELRRDVKTLTYLVREQRAPDGEAHADSGEPSE